MVVSASWKARVTLQSVCDTQQDIVLDDDSVKRFTTLCDLADELDAEFGDERDIVVLVDCDESCGVVSIDVDMLTLEGDLSKRFFETIQLADSLKFSTVDKEYLRVRFEVKGLWKRL